MEGFNRLIKQKGFTEIENHNTLLNEYARANNPLYCFVEDCGGQFIRRDRIYRTEIYGIYHRWAEQSGMLPLAANRFYSNLKAVLEIFGISVSEQGRFWSFEGEIEQEEENNNQKDIPNEKISEVSQEISRLFYDVHDKNSDYWIGLSGTIEMILDKHFREKPTA